MKIMRLAPLAAALLIVCWPAVADYTIKDGSGNNQTIKAGGCGGLICPQSTPADATGTPYSPSNPLPDGAEVQSGVGGVALTCRMLSAAATTNATSCKGATGRAYSIQGCSVTSSMRFLKLYNKASAPTVGTDTPVKTLPIPGGQCFVFDWSNIGYYFSAGIGYAWTVNNADADTTALTAGDVVGFNIDYN